MLSVDRAQYGMGMLKLAIRILADKIKCILVYSKNYHRKFLANI